LDSVRGPTNITTAPVSSSKFDFNIRLTIAPQLLERFRLWVNRVVLAARKSLLVYHDEQTFESQRYVEFAPQLRTWAPVFCISKIPTSLELATAQNEPPEVSLR
jgi:hypothetical protein